MMMTMMV